MNAMAPGRRQILGAAGALVVGFTLPAAAADPAGPRADPLAGGKRPDQLDSYLAIGTDGAVTVFFGKIDGGQGVDVAVGQIVAEELDLLPGRVHVVMGDTARTLNQGGASNASAISQGAVPLRNAAAEARLLLTEMASRALGVPAGELALADGMFTATSKPGARASFGELVGGRHFDTAVAWNGKYGNDLSIEGRAKPKPAAQYKVVGTPRPRSDIADKVFARHDYVTDVRLPGMLHARVIRPPAAGATVVKVDRSSVSGIPDVRVFQQGGFVAVLAPREWDAIRAMRQLDVAWSSPPPAFPAQEGLYDHIRNAPVQKRGVALPAPGLEQAMAGAARVVTAEYGWPFQGHTSMGPACALADVRADGFTVWTGSQKPHFARDGVAGVLGVKPESGRVIWVSGPGSYGRNDAGDAAIDAAVLSREAGRPVRLQYMRDDGHVWDAKSPASIHTARAGLDASGRIVALEFTSKSFSRLNVATSEADPRDSLANQLRGGPLNPGVGYYFPGDSLPLEAYAVPAKQVAYEVIGPLLDRASPLRTSHLRDPLGPELGFASESFMDELAAATGSDPLAFRLRHLTNERDIAALKAAADAAKWQDRPSGSGGGKGRGIALTHRDGTVVATVAEVAVDRGTGEVRVERLTVAHDCGLIVNPDGLWRCVQNAAVYATSRAMHEQVTFSRTAVTSVDWLSYPILDITETPGAVTVVPINRPDVAPSGAGEPAVRSVGAAIGNAIFDATGVRLRRGPFTADAVKAALS